MFCVQKPKLCVNERFYSHFSKYANVSTCCWQTANTRLTPCGPIACSMPGFPVLPSLPEFAQTRVCWVSDAIPPSHPLLPYLFLPSNFPSIRVFSNESALCIRWSNCWIQLWIQTYIIHFHWFHYECVLLKYYTFQGIEINIY